MHNMLTERNQVKTKQFWALASKFAYPRTGIHYLACTRLKKDQLFKTSQEVSYAVYKLKEYRNIYPSEKQHNT